MRSSCLLICTLVTLGLAAAGCLNSDEPTQDEIELEVEQGLISNFGVSAPAEYRDGPQPYYGIEAEAVVPANLNNIITGVGARVYADNVATLTIEYRRLYSDGSLGSRFRVTGGPQPQYTPTEVWGAVPEGYAISGVGFRASADNMSTMWIYARPITVTADGVRLSGDLYIYKYGHLAGQSTYPCEVTYLPGNHGLDENRAVITGVGLRVNSDNVATMKTLVSFL